MPHPRGAIWAERLLLAFILAALGGTLNLIIAIHRRSSVPPSVPDLTANVLQTPSVTPDLLSPVLASLPKADAVSQDGSDGPAQNVLPQPPRPPSPAAADDLTKNAVAKYSAAMSVEIAALEAADRRVQRFETGRKSAIAESERWKRRELLVRQQIDGLSRRAIQLEDTANALDAERDVLARERDALKAALAKASRKSGYAVLPYKGPNGTWRRPVVLECTNGGITLQPSGQSFSGLELSPRIHPRSSPIVRAVAREMLHIRSADTPDGAPAVPYLVFLVRPNGVRPYYEARSSLEPLGIAFGYELIDQDLAVDIPDLDNLATWDGSVPLDVPLEPAPRSKRALATNEPAGRDRAASAAGSGGLAQGTSNGTTGWQGGLAGRTQPAGGMAQGGGNSVTPEDFVWPSGSNSSNEPGTAGTGAAGTGPRGGALAGSIGGLVSTQPGSGSNGPGNGGQGAGLGAGWNSGSSSSFGSGGAAPGRTGGLDPAGTTGAGAGGDGRSLALGGGIGPMQGLKGAGTGNGFAPPQSPKAGTGNGLASTPSEGFAIGNGLAAAPSPGRESENGFPPTQSQGHSTGSGLAPTTASGTGASSSGNGPAFTLPDLEPAGSLDRAPGQPGTGSTPDPQGVAGSRGSTTGEPTAGSNASSQDSGDTLDPSTAQPGAGSTFGQNSAFFGQRPGGANGERSLGTSLPGVVPPSGPPLGSPVSGSPGPGATGTGTTTASSAIAGSSFNAPAQGSSGAANADPNGFRLPLSSGSTATAAGPDDSNPLAYPGSQQGGANGALAGSSGNAPSTSSGSPGTDTGGVAQGSSPGRSAGVERTPSPASGSGSGQPDPSLPPLPPTISAPTDAASSSDPAAVAYVGVTATAPASQSGQTASGAFQPANSPASQSQQSAPANASLSPSSSLPPALAGSRFGSLSSSSASSDSGLSSSSSGSSSSSLSSSAPAQIDSASSGLPLGSFSAMPQSAQGSPSLSFGQESSSKADAPDDFSPPHIALPDKPSGAIDVGFEIVVVCREHDLLLHPGGYVVTVQRLREPHENKESLLARELRAMVRKRAIVDPMIRPRPSIKFLVETNGDDTFWLARRQVLFALPDWPVSLQVSGSHDVRVFDKGNW